MDSQSRSQSEFYVGVTDPHQRRQININPPNPRPLYPNSASGNLPFMSFDLGASSSTSSAGLGLGLGGYGVGVPFGSLIDEEEAPLLEELGINRQLIMKKALSILNPMRVNAKVHEDADLSGPFLLCMVMGVCQLLAGKVQFGVILGWTCIASLFLYVVFNMLGGRDGRLDLYRCLSLVGYCMLPMVIFSALSLLLPRTGMGTLAMAGLTVLWCTRACTTLLLRLSPHADADQQRSLIAYACSLIYLPFSFLVVF